MTSPSRLLRQRRFLPLFATQFLGAFNDNLFKNALVMLVAYRLAAAGAPFLVTLAAGLFILPFFLFSATAGQLADKRDKAGLIRWVKLAEIPLMGVGAWGLVAGSVPLLLGALFLAGVQATFFGPLKYAILPQHLETDELVDGNGLIEAGTFLAVLLGTIAGGLLVLTENGPLLVAAAILLLAAAGWAASLRIPAAPPPSPDLRVDWNIVAATARIVGEARARRDVWLSILGISWFWLVGSAFLTQLPIYAKDVLGVDGDAVTLFLAAFSVGIGMGSVACGRLLRGAINAVPVPFAALGITLFALDLWLASPTAPTGGVLLGLGSFLAVPSSWRILADFALVAMCGGLFVVPLYAIVQSRSEPAERSRVIAANNVLNALFMVAAAVLAAGLLAAGVPVLGIFLVVALVNFAVAIYIVRLLPQAVLKGALAAVLRLLYRVEVTGIENVAKAGPRAVIVANHVSFLDGPLLAAFLSGRPSFAIDSLVARRWWVRPIFWFVDALTVDPTQPLAARTLIELVRKGRHAVIFPEGRITVTGSLMKIYHGPGMIADKADAPIVPVRIEGAELTPFSYLRGKIRLRWFPKIRLAILEPRRIGVPAELRGRARREAIGRRLYDVMTDMMFETSAAHESLFEAVLDARRRYGGGLVAVEDPTPTRITYDRFVLGSLVLGRRLAKRTAPDEPIGVMLPTSAGAAVAFFALQAFGRVPAMLNFTSGADTIAACCAAARVRTVLTSRRFVELAKLGPLVEALRPRVEFVYLEDSRERLHLGDKLYGLVAVRFARRVHRRHRGAPERPAAVLFTSGSEGMPKGVALSHANFLSNCRQLAARVDFSPSDLVLNALPIFHSFGLTGGLVLPLVSGVRTMLYPSPLHYRIVPEVAYNSNATIMFGTDTFLAGYARTANPYDFYSIRYVFAGAERVRPETRQAWMEKFGVRILEGYGATETSPVIAVNTPMHFRAGTVGRFLPDIAYALDPVEGLERGGRLRVRGPNVMLGYLKADRPGEIQPPADGWYDTGDLVDVDAEGYVTILGRAKRFAKIAGEMVSLAAIEALAAEAWPDAQHAVLAVADARRGERLLLATTAPGADRAALLARAKARGMPELWVPRSILVLDALPLLGTGKIDYPAVTRLVEERTPEEVG